MPVNARPDQLRGPQPLDRPLVSMLGEPPIFYQSLAFTLGGLFRPASISRRIAPDLVTPIDAACGALLSHVPDTASCGAGGCHRFPVPLAVRRWQARSWPTREHVSPRSKGHRLNDNQAIACVPFADWFGTANSIIRSSLSSAS